MWSLALAALLAVEAAADPAATAIGPHAREALLHAADAPATWPAGPRLQLAQIASTLDRRVYGYLPYWVQLDSSFRWDLVSDVIAFSVGIGADGSISNPHALPASGLVSTAHGHGVRVHLCATLFNSGGTPSEIATFLGSAAARSSAVSQLVQLVKSSGADGLNLDFEFVPSTSRDAFTAFVQQAHAALGAAVPSAELTIAMPSSTGYAGYDAAKLAAATERLLLMEYDYHWKTAPTAGANAPLPSDESAVNGFLQAAPASSLAMGVPYYGYDWPTSSTAVGASTLGPGATILINAFYTEAPKYGRLWDTGSQTPWFHDDSSGAHQGWCDDDQSLSLKYQFVKDKGLAGIMIWALGYDAGRTELWSAIAANFTSAPPPPPTSPGKLQLVSATFAPGAMQEGGLVTATLRVKNVGGQTVSDVAPPPSTVYDETQSATGSISGTWRLALDEAERPSWQEAHPFRWGAGKPLAPGEETIVNVQVRLEQPGTRTLWAAVIQEGTGVAQDNVGTTRVEVGAPDGGSTAGSGDGGSGSGADGGVADGGSAGNPSVSAQHGCAQAGSAWAPLGALLAALALRARGRRL